MFCWPRNERSPVLHGSAQFSTNGWYLNFAEDANFTHTSVWTSGCKLYGLRQYEHVLQLKKNAHIGCVPLILPDMGNYKPEGTKAWLAQFCLMRGIASCAFLMRLFTAIRTQQWHLWFPWAGGITRVTAGVPSSAVRHFHSNDLRVVATRGDGVVFFMNKRRAAYAA